MQSKNKESRKKGLLGRQGHSEKSKAPSNPFLFGCKKKAYETKEDALRSVCTKMKYENKTFDWVCFKAYKCQKCKKYHLTKAFNGKISSLPILRK
jgi:hypothetical protein